MSPFGDPWERPIRASGKFSGLQALGMSQYREGISILPASLRQLARPLLLDRSPQGVSKADRAVPRISRTNS